MKIDGFQAGKLYEAYSDKKASPAASKAAEPAVKDKTDRVEISSEASDMNQAKALAQKSADGENTQNRRARIDSIKKLVDAGEYRVSSKAVAHSILVGTNFDRRV